MPLDNDDRIIKHTTIGDVQAWSAPNGDVAINLSYYATIAHGTSNAAYCSQSLNLTAADARDLAKVLIEAADHADSVCIDRIGTAADLGCEVLP